MEFSSQLSFLLFILSPTYIISRRIYYSITYPITSPPYYYVPVVPAAFNPRIPLIHPSLVCATTIAEKLVDSFNITFVFPIIRYLPTLLTCSSYLLTSKQTHTLSLSRLHQPSFNNTVTRFSQSTRITSPTPRATIGPQQQHRWLSIYPRFFQTSTILDSSYKSTYLKQLLQQHLSRTALY